MSPSEAGWTGTLRPVRGRGDHKKPIRYPNRRIHGQDEAQGKVRL